MYFHLHNILPVLWNEKKERKKKIRISIKFLRGFLLRGQICPALKDLARREILAHLFRFLQVEQFACSCTAEMWVKWDRKWFFLPFLLLPHGEKWKENEKYSPLLLRCTEWLDSFVNYGNAGMHFFSLFMCFFVVVGMPNFGCWQRVFLLFLNSCRGELGG